MCIRVSWRQPVCPFEAGPEAISCDIQVYQVLLRCSSGEFKTQQRIGLSSTVWPKFMCEQLQLFTEIKYLASRKLWNLQT